MKITFSHEGVRGALRILPPQSSLAGPGPRGSRASCRCCFLRCFGRSVLVLEAPGPGEAGGGRQSQGERESGKGPAGEALPPRRRDGQGREACAGPLVAGRGRREQEDFQKSIREREDICSEADALGEIFFEIFFIERTREKDKKTHSFSTLDYFSNH